LIKKQTDNNDRLKREMKTIPVLEPFGDTKFWGFKTWPKIQKSWEKMNKKD